MATITEEVARAALNAASGRFDIWIAAQPWVEMERGWRVEGCHDGWRFSIERQSRSLSVCARTEEMTSPVAWPVPVQVAVLAD